MDTIQLIKGAADHHNPEIPELKNPGLTGQEVTVSGAVHTVRNMGKIAFVVLRKRSGLLQCVYEAEGPSADRIPLREITEGAVITVSGILKQNDKAPDGIEILLTDVKILARPTEPMPVPIAKERLKISLETNLNLRPLTLRNLRERAKFRIQEGIVRGFRDCLYAEGFTEIHTPKINSRGAEGGANVFKMDYFHRPAVLAQSPQFYKQMMVGVFDRVFETGPVFRAEKHNTKRHLNEYTSLDFEMAYIQDFTDLCEMETRVLQSINKVLARDYAKELEMLSAPPLPKTDVIPAVRFDDAKRLASEKYGRPIRNPYDLEPEEEALIGRYFKEEYDADYVFITYYPSKKRPFYAMDDPSDPKFTLSFDLLFRGLEVTTGGQRIHDYNELLAKIVRKKMTTEGLESYLSAFRHGMPPHGGLGIGLERMTMQMTGEDNVRETTLFPRDLSRLEP